MSKYLEPQYDILDKVLENRGLAQFGPMSSFTWNSDPKRMLFVLARYKFAAKVLEGCNNVIEIGCGDGFCARIVRQHVGRLLITDADPVMVEYAARTQSFDFPVTVACHNFCDEHFPHHGEKFDGAYLLDVLEHVPSDVEINFILNIRDCLKKNAKIVIGMPSLESQVYASEGSKAGHINCKTKEDLNNLLVPFFSSVICFSMNDEIVHTGFARMSNYVFAVCTV